MPGPPTTRTLSCPECGATAIAVIPSDGEPVERPDDADGKVWASCRDCGGRFLVHYSLDG